LEKVFRKKERTWTKKRLIIIIVVATVYSIWFDFLDTLVYCQPQGVTNDCKSIGQIFGGNQSYQVWNIAGHFIPGVIMLVFRPMRIELVFVGFLISTIIMDSPLWGVERLWHGNVLWQEKQSQTTSFVKWLIYYYNPFGLNRVWDHDWLFSNFPTAAMILWSLTARIVCVILWIWYQNKQELKEENFRSKGYLL
jgi:hypothetical protein